MSRLHLKYLLVFPVNCLMAIILGYLLQQIKGATGSDDSFGILPFELTTNVIGLVIGAGIFVVGHLATLNRKMENAWILFLVFLISIEGASWIAFHQSVLFLMIPRLIGGWLNGSEDAGTGSVAIILAIPLAHWLMLWIVRRKG